MKELMWGGRGLEAEGTASAEALRFPPPHLSYLLPLFYLRPHSLQKTEPPSKLCDHHAYVSYSIPLITLLYSLWNLLLFTVFSFHCLLSPPQPVFPPYPAQFFGSPPNYSLRYTFKFLAPLDVSIHLVKSNFCLYLSSRIGLEKCTVRQTGLFEINDY